MRTIATEEGIKRLEKDLILNDPRYDLLLRKLQRKAKLFKTDVETIIESRILYGSSKAYYDALWEDIYDAYGNFFEVNYDKKPNQVGLDDLVITLEISEKYGVHTVGSLVPMIKDVHFIDINKPEADQILYKKEGDLVPLVLGSANVGNSYIQKILTPEELVEVICHPEEDRDPIVKRNDIVLMQTGESYSLASAGGQSLFGPIFYGISSCDSDLIGTEIGKALSDKPKTLVKGAISTRTFQNRTCTKIVNND